MKAGLLASVLLLTPAPAFTHRLDEYLQQTLISLGKDRVRAEISLTPGVAVFPIVAAAIGARADGTLSEAEERAYVRRVLRDLTFTIDGRRLTPQLLSMRFPSAGEMKEGMGAIRIELQADLPRGGPRRRLVFENHHQSNIGAYLVNCLEPTDPEIRIVGQNRNYSQSLYEVEYTQAGASSVRLSALWSDDRAWLAVLALVLFTRFAYLRRLAR